MISMKNKEGIWGWEPDISKLPQDGQRMVSYLEKKAEDDTEHISDHVADDWIESSDLKNVLKDAIKKHLIKTGRIPTFFTTKILISHEEHAHRFNHEMLVWLDSIIDSVKKEAEEKAEANEEFKKTLETTNLEI